jgi:competence protein CoiA
VARFGTVVDDRMRQLAIDLGDEPGWGVHKWRITNREPPNSTACSCGVQV